MLKIPKSVEYAVLALKFIGEQEEHCTTKEISESVNIPYNLLAKILQKLNKENIITSVQGAKGGYFLKSSASKITLNKIIEAVEHPLQLTDCMVEKPSADACKRFDNCCLVNPLNRIQLKIAELFENTTLLELTGES